MNENDPTLFTDMKYFYTQILPHTITGLLIAILLGASIFRDVSKTVIIQTVTTSVIIFFIANCYYFSRLILYLVNWGISIFPNGSRSQEETE